MSAETSQGTSEIQEKIQKVDLTSCKIGFKVTFHSVIQFLLSKEKTDLEKLVQSTVHNALVSHSAQTNLNFVSGGSYFGK